jgi:TPR repeat protein
MRTTREKSLASASAVIALAFLASVLPAQAQTAVDATQALADLLDGAGIGVSSDISLSALENAAENGQPMALWQLGTMYENGDGVDRDPARAFGYFAQIADQHADTPPRGLEADIVARSFVKLSDYYKDGMPDAGVSQDKREYYKVLQHAASYFDDADAQYKVGLLYQQEDGLGYSPLLSARWLRSAADKGHCMAQASLGDLLFNGAEGYAPQPVEGLKWLLFAHRDCTGTLEQPVVDEMTTRAMSAARTEDRALAASLVEAEIRQNPRF